MISAAGIKFGRLLYSINQDSSKFLIKNKNKENFAMNINVSHQINMFFAKVKGHGKEGETVGCRV